MILDTLSDNYTQVMRLCRGGSNEQHNVLLLHMQEMHFVYLSESKITTCLSF